MIEVIDKIATLRLALGNLDQKYVVLSWHRIALFGGEYNELWRYSKDIQESK